MFAFQISANSMSTLYYCANRMVCVTVLCK